MSATKIKLISEAVELGWSPDGSPRRVTPSRRVAPEVLLRSPLYLVPRPPVRRPSWRETLSVQQDRIYAMVVLAAAVALWWGAF